VFTSAAQIFKYTVTNPLIAAVQPGFMLLSSVRDKQQHVVWTFPYYMYMQLSNLSMYAIIMTELFHALQ